jgi:hypothetical protein
VSGTDYDPPGTVNIPAGQSSVTVPVHALTDNVPDDGETVTAAVSSGAGYTAGQPSQATVTINDPAATACENATPSSFTDRNALPVHAGNIDCITQYGIAQGFTDNTYRPALATTRRRSHRSSLGCCTQRVSPPGRRVPRPASAGSGHDLNRPPVRETRASCPGLFAFDRFRLPGGQR